jgi:anti-sigma B factor antagonist
VACSFESTRGYAGYTVLALQGDLDIRDRAKLSSRLTASVSRGPWVIVDLTDLAFMDCSSLTVLVGARERARLAGGDVLLAGPRRMVARLLLLTNQDQVFSVFPSVGVAAFSAGLAAIGTRLAADGARESPAAATEGMVTAAVNLRDGGPGPAADSNGDSNSSSRRQRITLARSAPTEDMSGLKAEGRVQLACN